MCNFFSFVTEPEHHGGRRFYFDWEYRKKYISCSNDSHSIICTHYGLNEDRCNKYEFNPITKRFDAEIHSTIDDRIQAEEWVNNLDFKRVVEPLIVKPVIKPLEFPKVEEVTPEQIELLQKWALVNNSVLVSISDFVWASVGNSAKDLVWNTLLGLVWDSTLCSIRKSIGHWSWRSLENALSAFIKAYVSSFFDIEYELDFSPAMRLWESGLVPSFDGTTWRLHSGKNAEVVYEMKQ